MRTAPLNHPNGATGYRIEHGGKSICYITDTEHRAGERDKTIVELCRGADVMIYDSSYTDDEYARYQGWGHSTWQEGVRVADAAERRHARDLPSRPQPRRRLHGRCRARGGGDASRHRAERPAARARGA